MQNYGIYSNFSEKSYILAQRLRYLLKQPHPNLPPRGAGAKKLKSHHA